jgi:hypothetical protein
MMTYFLKYLLIMIFLGSAISKIVGFYNTLIYFAGISNISFPFLTSFILIIIILELLIPVLIWINNLKSKIIYISIQFLLVIFLITNILLFFMGVENCGCFGAGIQSHPSLGIPKTFFLIMIVYYLREGKLFPIRLNSRKPSV